MMAGKTKRLPTFAETKDQATSDLYYPWEIDEIREPEVLFPADAIFHPAALTWDSPFNPPGIEEESALGFRIGGLVKRGIARAATMRSAVPMMSEMTTQQRVVPFPGRGRGLFKRRIEMARIMPVKATVEAPTAMVPQSVPVRAGFFRGIRRSGAFGRVRLLGPGVSGLGELSARTPKLTRFRGAQSLRQAGKVAVMGRLNILTSEHVPGRGTYPAVLRYVRQRPYQFPELAGFGETPVGSANPTGTAAPATGFWGNLESLLTKAGTVVLQTQTERAQRDIAASQAATAAAQAQQAQAGMLATLYRNLPIIAAVGGGGVLLYIFMQRRRRGV